MRTPHIGRQYTTQRHMRDFALSLEETIRGTFLPTGKEVEIVREIGGDFEITWPGTVYQPMVDASWYDELGGSPLYWYSSGRMGLRAILRSIPKGTFLVPSYLCASILWAFRQEGVSVKLLTPDLQGDVAGSRHS